MLSLEEIVERGTASAERTIRESKAMDYAWMQDQIAVRNGEQPNHLHDLINRQYESTLEELYGDDGDT